MKPAPEEPKRVRQKNEFRSRFTEIEKPGVYVAHGSQRQRAAAGEDN
jgi:hypothetical protein